MKPQMKFITLMLTIAFSIITLANFAQQMDNENLKVQKTGNMQSHDIQNPSPAQSYNLNAIPPPPPPPPPPPVPPVCEKDHEMMPPMLPIPNLTPEQQELIRKSDLKQMEAITPLQNQIREKTARLNSILTIQPVNTKEANKIADEIGQVHASILKVHISHDLDLRNILTADQKIIFDAKPKPFLRRGGK